MDLAPKQARTANSTESSTVEQRLRFFMQDVTGRALVMMESATQGQQGIAMDLVQEAFISLHKSYADKDTEEWYPLFYTILNNKLQDWRRKESRRAHPFSLFKKVSLNDDDESIDIVDENTLTHLNFLTKPLLWKKFKQRCNNYPFANNKHLCSERGKDLTPQPQQAL